MEATGIYYESLAYHLHKLKQQVVVVLPNTSKHYFLSLNIKTKTDNVDAKILSQFAIEREHRLWLPPHPEYLKLRNLTRYYVQLQEYKTALGNILHSKEAGEEVQKEIIKSNQQLIKQLDKQMDVCKKEIDKVIAANSEVKKQVELLTTIPGLGKHTVATILAETLGFEHIKSAKQLVSYAGYDVVERESGTSIKGKTRISKKGNRYIRNALYFPAMVAARHNQSMKTLYQRIIVRKPSKMIGQVAVQRKLLTLMYAMHKNQTPFDLDYKKIAPIKSSEAIQDNAMLPS